MVNATLKEMHDLFPEDDRRHFPWETLAEVEDDSLYCMGDVVMNGEAKKARGLHDVSAEVSALFPWN
jgi:hypothetical protein